jgi:TPR repeat protein
MLCVLVLLSIVSPARALPDGPDLAFGAFQRGLFRTAFQEAMKRVDSDSKDAAAMTLVAELLSEGLGVPQNLEEAMRWYRLAAELGDKNAQFALGMAFLTGKGETRDVAAAAALFEKAAAQDHPGAWYNLGVIALEGNGVASDFARAATDFHRSANLGFAEAAYSLGLLYREGRGVEKDPKQAAFWLFRAAQGDDLAAQVEYGIMLFNGGEGVPADEAGGAKWLLRAANRDNPVAQNRVARLLFAGRGLKQDRVEAMKWHILATSAGLRDTWLDSESEKLTPAERLKVQDVLRAYLGK